MFTEYTREEIQTPTHLKIEGVEHSGLSSESSALDEDQIFEVKDYYFHTDNSRNNELNQYDLDGESLW